jgi:sugar O-acyltransferase (sialic acid O-acetyltransferase NeuD family)
VQADAGTESAVIYGASGHGKVVADILRARGVEIEGFIDDNQELPREHFGLRILGDRTWLAREATHRPITVVLGIGDNLDRRAVAERMPDDNIRLLTAAHPSATISPFAKIAPGVVIMPQAVVNANAVIGRGTIVNTGAIVEHDCVVGNYVHLSPKTVVGGHVEIGDLAWLGIGSSVIPGLKIGKGSIIGAGATVITDIDDWVVAVGNPARVLKKMAQVV